MPGLRTGCVGAGPYSVELVPNDARVDVHITFDDDGAVATETMTGAATVLLDDKPVRTPLVPSTARVLSGDTPG